MLNVVLQYMTFKPTMPVHVVCFANTYLSIKWNLMRLLYRCEVQLAIKLGRIHYFYTHKSLRQVRNVTVVFQSITVEFVNVDFITPQVTFSVLMCVNVNRLVIFKYNVNYFYRLE